MQCTEGQILEQQLLSEDMPEQSDITYMLQHMCCQLLLVGAVDSDSSFDVTQVTAEQRLGVRANQKPGYCEGEFPFLQYWTLVFVEQLKNVKIIARLARIFYSRGRPATNHAPTPK